MDLSETYTYKTDRGDLISIYEHDLKYKKFRNIKLDQVVDLKDKYDYDTLDARYEESKRNILDISHLDLSVCDFKGCNINQLFYLFASNNCFRSLCLDQFSNLKVLDICHNKLTHIPSLPQSLEELLCKKNSLANLDSLQTSKLKRLNCSKNYITSIPSIDTLEILVCEHNQLTIIPRFKNLTKLSCSDNSIISISDQSTNLLVIECDNNKLSDLYPFPKLKELYISNNKISEFQMFNSIEVIHCYNNPVSKIPYYKSLTEVVCNYRGVALSTSYKLIEAINCKDDTIHITFETA